MFVFSYNATDRNGAPNTGTIEAESVAAAVAQLEQQGLTVSLIQLVGPVATVSEALPLSTEEVEQRKPNDPLSDPILLQRVESLLAHRETILPLLSGLAEELAPGAKRQQLRRMIEQLQSTSSSDDLIRSKDFARSWLPVLAGQATPSAAVNFQRIMGEVLETSEIRRQQVRSYLYPALIALLAFGVFAFCSIVVIPVFVDIYNDFDMDLPSLTVFVLNIAMGLIRHPIQFLVIVLAGVALMYVVYRVLRMSTLIRNVAGGLFGGSSRQLNAMANFLWTLAEARGLGMSSPAALRLAGDSVPQDWIREESYYLADALESGTSDSLPSFTSFPSSVLSAIRPGLGQQASVTLLKSVAETYSERVRRRLDWATGFAPQMAILVVGMTVGLIVIAIYLPLIDLLHGLSG